MLTDEQDAELERRNDFANAADEAQPGFFAEFLDFLLHNQKWWITPILVVLLLVSMLLIYGTGALAPFIYPLF